MDLHEREKVELIFHLQPPVALRNSICELARHVRLAIYHR